MILVYFNETRAYTTECLDLIRVRSSYAFFFSSRSNTLGPKESQNSISNFFAQSVSCPSMIRRFHRIFSELPILLSIKPRFP